MAIVANLGNASTPIDKSFCTWNRRNAGAPGGAIVPQFAGEIILDSTNNTYWRAVGLANTDWVAETPRV